MSNESVVEKALIEASAAEISKVEEGNFIQLRQAAQDFIDRVTDIATVTTNVLSASKITTMLTAIYRDMRHVEGYAAQALVLQHAFEERLNSFMGRTIYLTYVNPDGTIYFYDDANIGLLYSQATTNKGRGNISAGKMFEANDLEDELQARMRASMNQRKEVYVEALRRWSSNDAEATKEYDPSAKTFYWRLYDSRHITGWTHPISNKGPIAEGYAGAVINEDGSVTNANLEWSLKALYENHIQKDSLGGAVRGDVVWDGNGNIQFAVKMGSFSTARFGQYLRLAYNITQFHNLTPAEFEAHLPKLVRITKATQAIIDDANNKSEEELVAEIRKMGVNVTSG